MPTMKQTKAFSALLSRSRAAAGSSSRTFLYRAAGLSSAAKGKDATRSGALCYDYAFKMVLGTKGQSEEILRDMLSALRQFQTGDKSPVEEVRFIDLTVRAGLPPQGKSELLVDVRASNSDNHYIAEIQRRPEARFPQRAILYSSADLVSQHVARRNRNEKLKPMHMLAFCDYDFADGDSGIGVSSTHWRLKGPSFTPEVSRALQSYSLQSDDDMLLSIGGTRNAPLSAEMRSRMSFVFALLPHAPLLQNLRADTPPLLRWAALVAHVNPDEISAVPKCVREIPAVKKMLDVLHDSSSQIKIEQERIEDDKARFLEQEGDMFDDGVREGRAEGKAEGKAEVLASMGITSVSEYRSKIGKEPLADVASALLDE